jgi:hypothetical protein
MRGVERAEDSAEFNRQRYLFRISMNRSFITASYVAAVGVVTAILVNYIFEKQTGFTAYYWVRNVLCVLWFGWAAVRLVSQYFEYDFFVPTPSDSYDKIYNSRGQALPFPILAMIFSGMMLIGWIFIFISPTGIRDESAFVITMADNSATASLKIVPLITFTTIGTVAVATVLCGYVKYFLRAEK